MTSPLRCFRFFLRALLALSTLALGAGLSLARAQESLSGPLSDPLSPSVYDESLQNGPSSSILPQGTSLLLPTLHSGISDPLGFLLETGAMSPFLPGNNVVGYPYYSVQTQILTDPFLELQAGEYRNNRLLMSDAGARSLAAGRLQAAGGVVPTANGGRAAGFGLRAAATGTQSFSAGSHAGLAAGLSSDMSPGLAAGSQTDASYQALSGLPASSSSDAGLGGAGSAVQGGEMGYALPSDAFSSASGAATGTLVSRQGADGMPTGPSPGDLFPQVTVATASGTGFEDSTMGTAGSREFGDLPSGTSLLSGRLSGDQQSSFAEMSSQTTSFLHPSLHGATGLPVRSSTLSVRELTREKRLDALIHNPNASMPSPFQERALQRAYVEQQRRGRARRPTTIPSIIPHP